MSFFLLLLLLFLDRIFNLVSALFTVKQQTAAIIERFGKFQAFVSLGFTLKFL